jgi:hypothetical protein
MVVTLTCWTNCTDCQYRGWFDDICSLHCKLQVLGCNSTLLHPPTYQIKH